METLARGWEETPLVCAAVCGNRRVLGRGGWRDPWEMFCHRSERLEQMG